MKKFTIALLVALLPLALFAQAAAPADKQADLLKSFKLSDAQITQVRDIEKTTRTTIESDFAHLRLLESQIHVALIPSTGNPDLTAINKLIDQKTQLRGDMEKALVAARVQLAQIMGKDNFDKYSRNLRQRGPNGEGRGMGMGRGGFGGRMGGQDLDGPEGGRGDMMW